MRIVFLGNDPWSVPSLEAVAASEHEVAVVLTRVPRPAGRGGKLRPTAVADAARSLGLRLDEVETVKRGDGFERLRDAAGDALVVVAYGEILPPAVLEVALPLNVHFSLLPRLRGADPVRRAILEGHDVTGVSIMRMDEGMDTGPVFLQAEEPIREDDDAGSLGARLARTGGALLVEALDRLAAGDLEAHPQDEERASLAPKLGRDEEWIDWGEPADAVLRRVRALAPEPGTRTRFRGKIVKVLRAAAAAGEAEPGTIVGVSKDGVIVGTGRGAVSLLEVVPEGRRRISGAEFARGYRPEAGEELLGPA